MRTLDRDYLDTHPGGAERTEFTLSMPVPESVKIPDNPDGTRPKITLKATSDTYGDLISVPSYVHDEEVADNVFALVLASIDEEKLDEFPDLAPAGRPKPKMRTITRSTQVGTKSWLSPDAPSAPAGPEVGGCHWLRRIPGRRPGSSCFLERTGD